MITLEDALPGRIGRDVHFGPAHRARHAAARPVAGRARGRVLRHGLLLGRRADLLADARASTRPRSATRVGSPRTRRTRRPAPAAPVTPRPSRSSTTRPRSPTPTCSRCSGRTTTRPRACGRATTSARSTGRRSTPPPRRSSPRRSRRGTRSQPAVKAAGLGDITTEIAQAGPFYYAEDYHQQYLSESEEPERVLQPRPQRPDLPRRRRPHIDRRALACATRDLASTRAQRSRPASQCHRTPAESAVRLFEWVVRRRPAERFGISLTDFV